MKFGEFFGAVCDTLRTRHGRPAPEQTMCVRSGLDLLDIIHDQYGLAMMDALDDGVHSDFQSYAGQAAYKINEAWTQVCKTLDNDSCGLSVRTRKLLMKKGHRTTTDVMCLSEPELDEFAETVEAELRDFIEANK